MCGPCFAAPSPAFTCLSCPQGLRSAKSARDPRDEPKSAEKARGGVAPASRDLGAHVGAERRPVNGPCVFQPGAPQRASLDAGGAFLPHGHLSACRRMPSLPVAPRMWSVTQWCSARFGPVSLKQWPQELDEYSPRMDEFQGTRPHGETQRFRELRYLRTEGGHQDAWTSLRFRADFGPIAQK